MFRCRDIVSLLLIFFKECYCTFKNHELWSWKDNWCLQFSLSPIILTDLLGHGFDLWLVDFDLFVCFCVSRFIACDHNIMIDGCEKCNYEGSFWTLESSVCEKCITNQSGHLMADNCMACKRAILFGKVGRSHLGVGTQKETRPPIQTLWEDPLPRIGNGWLEVPRMSVWKARAWGQGGERKRDSALIFYKF